MAESGLVKERIAVSQQVLVCCFVFGRQPNVIILRLAMHTICLDAVCKLRLEAHESKIMVYIFEWESK